MGSSNEPTQKPKKYITNPQYGGQVILSQLTGTVYQCLQLQQRNLVSFQKLLQKRKRLSHPSLLTVIGSFSKSLTNNAFACGNQNKIEMYIEYSYLSRTLEDIMEEHSQLGKDVPEKLLIAIFAQVVEVLYYLKSNLTCHGDIKASSILFDHVGKPKLIDSYFVNGGKTSYQIVMQNPSSMSLLSPEQLQRIRNRQFEEITTVYKSQIFSVGLVMLQAMTFENAMECYDLNKLEVKKGYIEIKERELRQGGYSGRLIDLVMKCLSFQPQKRPSHQQFLRAIRSI